MKNKKLAIGLFLVLLAAALLFRFLPHDAHAQKSDFEKMQDAAKYCTNPTDTDPKCAESFAEMRGIMHSSSNDPQRTAQEKIGIVGIYREDDGFNATEYLSAWNYNNIPANERGKFYKETKRADGSLLREY